MNSLALPLRQNTLSRLGGRADVPAYARNDLTPAVVHLSVGCFHRSHQAVYFDDFARLGETGWGITGIGHRRRALSDALRAQDGLYTVVERGPGGDSARVVGAIGRYLFAPDATEAVVAAMADVRTRLVTLTITAAGYQIDPVSGAFAVDDPDVAGDLSGRTSPRSALGQIVAALGRRRRAGMAPFTVLSCDNLAANGSVARDAVIAFAALRDPTLASWIEERVAFPCSLVDRITPTTTDADRRLVAREFGIEDRWPVVTEPFSQWIVEDDFCNGRPPLDEVGVQFVSDVRPYAQIKTRLLNATHCALGHLGVISQYASTSEVMSDPVLSDYAVRLMSDEVQPLLPRVLDMDLDAYQATLLDRLSNPGIVDQLTRLGRSGSSKVPRHILPSIVSSRAAGRPHPLLTLAVAAWCRYLRGVDEGGAAFDIEDPAAVRLQTLARAGRSDPRGLLRVRSVFGNLADDADFADEVTRALEDIDRLGARGAIACETSGSLAA